MVLLGAVFISFSGVFVKISEISPTGSAFYRVLIGGLLLLPAAGIKGELHPVNVREFGRMTFCGFAFALDLYFWHESIGYIGPGLATIVGNFQVFILSTIGIVFLHEPLRARFLIAIPLAVGGLFLIIGDGNGLGPGYQTGIAYALITAFCYAAFLITLRKIQGNAPDSVFSPLMFVSFLTAIFLGAKMVFTGDSFAIPDVKTLGAVFGLGLFSQTLGWLLIGRAMPKIRASLTGFILLLQPALAFCWDVLFFSRPTDIINWVGVLITLAAIHMGVSQKPAKE